MIDLTLHDAAWIWLVVAVLTGFELLAPKGWLKRCARTIAGLAFCGAVFFTLQERMLQFFSGVGACAAKRSAECALLVAGDTMPVSLFVGMTVFLGLEFMVLLWQRRRAMPDAD